MLCPPPFQIRNVSLLCLPPALPEASQAEFCLQPVPRSPLASVLCLARGVTGVGSKATPGLKDEKLGRRRGPSKVCHTPSCVPRLVLGDLCELGEAGFRF